MSRPARPRSPLERLVQDPAGPGILMMAALVVGGFVAVWFGWRGVARAMLVPLQVPEILTGGLAGVALIGLGAGLLNIHIGRRDAAEERRRTDRVLDEVASLRAVAPQLRSRLARARSQRPSEQEAGPRRPRTKPGRKSSAKGRPATRR